jgi:predicted ArsR family transcriptional regulator
MADQPADPQTAFLDAKGMRVLAHPARVQLVHLLRKHGTSTATRLAQLMGVNSGTASYHLRQLAAAGFVEEDTERGNGRDRWWRAAHRQTVLEETNMETDGDTTVAYLQSVAATHAMHTQRALSELQTMPAAWRDDVFAMSEYPLRLTVEEAARLRDELGDLIAQYRRDEPGAAAPDGAERLTAMIYLHPDLETEDDT